MSTRRLRRAPLLALALALGGAAVARPLASQAPVQPASSAAEPSLERLTSRLDRPTRDAVVAMLADARERGLPSAPLLAKALEGVEKGAPAPRIEHAVRAMLVRLDAARVALDPSVGDAEVVAGADAIAVGVPLDVLRRIRALSPHRSTATALGVLAQLVSREVPVEKAAKAVTGLLKRGAAPSQLLALDRDVQRDVATGVPPATALDLRTATILAGLPSAPPIHAGDVGDAAAAPGRKGPAAPATPTVPTAPPGVPTNAPPP